MLNALYETSQMLVTVKRLELGIDKRGKQDENEIENEQEGSAVNKSGTRRKRSGSKKKKQ